MPFPRGLRAQTPRHGRRKAEPLGLIMMDLDHFKDTGGADDLCRGRTEESEHRYFCYLGTTDVIKN
jgi:hypothetical protein